MAIKLPEDIAKKYTVAKKASPVFVLPALGGITVDLRTVKMVVADKLAKLDPPILIAIPKK